MRGFEQIYSSQEVQSVAEADRLTFMAMATTPRSSDRKSFEAPYYDLMENRAHLDFESGSHENIRPHEYLALIHEVEHSFTTNRSPLDRWLRQKFRWLARHRLQVKFYDAIYAIADRLLQSPRRHVRLGGAILIYILEAPSVGAQWELASRIPKNVRAQLIAQLKQEQADLARGNSQYGRAAPATEKTLRLQTAEETRKIAIATLENAHLYKRQFIIKLMEVHGYGLQQHAIE